MPVRHDGPVAAVTRARLSLRKAATFWRAVPPVSADLHAGGGVRLAVGIGEAPVGLQGTLSLWESATALREFAHRRPAHVEAIRRTAEEGWYSEELFARFAVESCTGTLGGVDPLAGALPAMTRVRPLRRGAAHARGRPARPWPRSSGGCRSG